MKLTKEQRAAIENALQKLRDQRHETAEAIGRYNAEVAAAFAELSEAVGEFNQRVRSAWDEHVSGAVESYGEAASDLDGEVQSIADDMRGAYDDRSDRWRESDAGAEADGFISDLENFEAERFEPDQPDEIEVDEPDDLDEPDEIEDPDWLG